MLLGAVERRGAFVVGIRDVILIVWLILGIWSGRYVLRARGVEFVVVEGGVGEVRGSRRV